MVHGSRPHAGAGGTRTPREAVASAAVVSTLEARGEDVLGERIVLDPSAAATAQLRMAHPGDSVAQQVQTRFPRARTAKGLNMIVLPRRRVVERTSAWISGYRRCGRDHETRPDTREAGVRLSMIMLMSRDWPGPGQW